jgi:hypothetical protein
LADRTVMASLHAKHRRANLNPADLDMLTSLLARFQEGLDGRCHAYGRSTSGRCDTSTSMFIRGAERFECGLYLLEDFLCSSLNDSPLLGRFVQAAWF